MAFREAIAKLPIDPCEIEVAHLAREPARLGENLFSFSLDKCMVTFAE